MTSTEFEKSSKAVVLVDDEVDILTIFKRVLEMAGYRVSCFTNAGEALEHLRANISNCGLIISDVRMPGMSGIEFATKIRQIDCAIPFILMTAFDRSALDMKTEMRIADFLQKPVLPTQLRELVSKYLPITVE